MSAVTHPTETKPAVQAIIDAAATRTSRFEQIDAERSEKRRQANADFVTEVRSAINSGETNMSELARAIGLSRGNLHDIVKTHSPSQ